MADEAAQCIFCRIIAGEMESRKVYEDERAFACLDIRPGVKGHTLLMPKEHYPILPILPQKEFEHLFGLLPTLLSALGGALGKTGANVFIANGAAAGQQSPHFLMHLLPREPMDSLNLYALRGEGALREHDELLPVLRQKLGKLGASGAAGPALPRAPWCLAIWCSTPRSTRRSLRSRRRAPATSSEQGPRSPRSSSSCVLRRGQISSSRPGTRMTIRVDSLRCMSSPALQTTACVCSGSHARWTSPPSPSR